MGTTQDKRKEKDGDGLPTIAIADAKDSDRATIPHLEGPSPELRFLQPRQRQG